MLTPAERDACIRYRPDSGRGHTESLFVKLNLPPGDPSGYAALWLKLTVLCRTIGRQERLVEGWAIAFAADPSGANGHVALKNSWPIKEAAIQYDCFFIETPAVQWRHGHLEGVLTDPKTGREIRWNLDYEPDHQSFRHFPKSWMYERGIPKTKACSPQIDTRMSGAFSVDGVDVDVTNAPAMLGHNWGGAQSEFWAWTHCNAWDTPGVVFEAVTSKVKFGPMTSPLLTISHLRFPREETTLNSWGAMLKTESTVDGLSWTLAGAAHDRRFELVVQAPADRFVGVDYHDPDGRVAHCLNTKIADSTLTVWARTGAGWEEMLKATAQGTAALEIGDRTGTRGVKTYIY